MGYIREVDDEEPEVQDDDDLELVMDPTAAERRQCIASTTFALMPNLNRITSMSQVGPVPGDRAIEAMDLCTSGCTTLYEMMRNCLLADHQKRTSRAGKAAATNGANGAHPPPAPQ